MTTTEGSSEVGGTFPLGDQDEIGETIAQFK
jgi:hypothetical protein